MNNILFTSRNCDNILTSEANEILSKRALFLSDNNNDNNKIKKLDEYFSFQLGKVEKYGFPYSYLKEVLKVKEVTKVPDASNNIAGVINFHGKILPVINLKNIFDIDEPATNNDIWIVVVENKKIILGFLVDEVFGNEVYNKKNLSDNSSFNNNPNNKYVSGIYKGPVVMLNVDSLLEGYC